MIAVDGDSSAMMTETGIPIKHKWPYLLGDNRGDKVECFARQKSTARDCMLRAWRVISRRPSWYVLMIGQWSQNHEHEVQFEHYVRAIIEEMHLHGVRVCLMTPPTEVTDLDPYIRVLHRCSLIYNVGIIDVFERLRQDSADDTWFEGDSSVRCHFSHLGATNIIRYFNEPHTAHLCLP